MERLTYYRDSDKAVCPKFLASQFSPEFFTQFVQKAFEKLARYEDLGYEPEELRRFLNHDGEDDWEDIK